jgi:intracellular multiplication protein IcmE
MSDAAIPKKASRPRQRSVWSGAGRAGPRRLLFIGVSGLALVSVIAAITLSGKSKPLLSSVARMQTVNANPGGLNSNPEQDALALNANDIAASKAFSGGKSYTPPIAPSVAVVNQTPAPPPTAASSAPLPTQHFVGHTPPPQPPAAVVQPADVPVFPPPLPGTAVVQPPMVQVADTGGTDQNQETALTNQLHGYISQWNGRPPMTDVVLPPALPTTSETSNANGTHTGSGSRSSEATDPDSDAADPDDPAQHVLIPAGRGIFAHPILALSSDATSPVVLQADSGPIAGDRMIGNFATEKDRLIINISQIIHNGQSVNCSGVVIAPDTMEAAVASGVNQHYIARFALPAAAAFIQGLGNALATTSNSTSVLSPLGGATTVTNLNFHQQLGVAAGAAASQIGSTLNQDAPKGPTVTLDANVAVGVMFLTDVKAPSGT